MITDQWSPSDVEAFVKQEREALDRFVTAGVVLETEPQDERRPHDCTFCQWHAYDANGENLDGGTASSLWGWYRDGYIAETTTLRRVVGAVDLEGQHAAR